MTGNITNHKETISGLGHDAETLFPSEFIEYLTKYEKISTIPGCSPMDVLTVNNLFMSLKVIFTVLFPFIYSYQSISKQHSIDNIDGCFNTHKDDKSKVSYRHLYKMLSSLTHEESDYLLKKIPVSSSLYPQLVDSYNEHDEERFTNIIEHCGQDLTDYLQSVNYVCHGRETKFALELIQKDIISSDNDAVSSFQFAADTLSNIERSLSTYIPNDLRKELEKMFISPLRSMIDLLSWFDMRFGACQTEEDLLEKFSKGLDITLLDIHNLW